MLTNASKRVEGEGKPGAPKDMYIVQVEREKMEDGGRLVHNCTIFLCSLDVRNIVQGGDPLYAGFFSTQGSGGYT